MNARTIRHSVPLILSRGDANWPASSASGGTPELFLQMKRRQTARVVPRDAENVRGASTS